MLMVIFDTKKSVLKGKNRKIETYGLKVFQLANSVGFMFLCALSDSVQFRENTHFLLILKNLKIYSLKS